MAIEDKDLLMLLESDPEQGVLQLKARYEKPLHFAASQRLSSQSDVRECVSDAFADFYLQRDQFDAERGSLGSYLAAIVDRKAIRKYRENQRQWLAAELARQSGWDIEAWEQSEHLRHALEQLSEQDRQIMELKYFHGHTAREIAGRTGLEYETVKKRLQRGLKKLLRLLEE